MSISICEKTTTVIVLEVQLVHLFIEGTDIDTTDTTILVTVHPSDIQKTAITTPFGLFEFPFMSLGLRSAAKTFQRFMDEVLRGLDFCFAYLDDILLFSRSLEEHERHLRSLVGRLQTFGIIINPRKCVFRAS
jgi:hypothetical protein